jgi:TatD DNase family protein
MYRIKNPGIYDEVVFCGYGEPFERFETLKKVAEWLKKMGAKSLRINTCGLGYLITGRDNILDELKGIIDAFNVSVNASNPEEYYRIVKPKFGRGSRESLLKFIKDAREKGFRVIASAVNYPGFDEKAFEKFAKELGVEFKIRNFKRFKKWEE